MSRVGERWNVADATNGRSFRFSTTTLLGRETLRDHVQSGGSMRKAKKKNGGGFPHWLGPPATASQPSRYPSTSSAALFHVHLSHVVSSYFRSKRPFLTPLLKRLSIDMIMPEIDEIDVVSCSPAPSSDAESEIGSGETRPPDDVEAQLLHEKKYYCQRCLNHDLHYPRKGHKPYCRFSVCKCEDCSMVEQRRQLNNMLSRKRLQLPTSPREMVNGRRIRDPQCARCGAHGVKIPLRGHKKSMCQFATCSCQLCALVENRRTLMAKQIKLRRDQQRQRDGAPVAAAISRRSSEREKSISPTNTESSTASGVTPSPPLGTGPSSAFHPIRMQLPMFNLPPQTFPVAPQSSALYLPLLPLASPADFRLLATPTGSPAALPITSSTLQQLQNLMWLQQQFGVFSPK
ncbi:unnamed protein product [Caenorhabditis auriculariae]|uniref:DM domain-containing protein n=1 Tax=Caenorhabditis auriculariae TaxID=2777116 RepID=A0A8S1HQH5_9PELO|nr:unnamed protein product [Caenorhabditis auriculariae]